MKIADIQPEEPHASVAVDELQIVRLKNGQQDAKRPAGRRNDCNGLPRLRRGCRVRTDGNIVLNVPVRTRPLSSEFAGLAGLSAPVRTLPSSSLARSGCPQLF